MIALSDEMVDVSHGIGIPFGGIGAGYSVFGKFGFCEVNFDSTPNEATKNYPHIPQTAWRYDIDRQTEGPMQFVLIEGNRKTVFSEKSISWLAETDPVDAIKAFAYLPKGYFQVICDRLRLDIAIEAFSPMIPYDLDQSSIPVQIFNITLTNKSDSERHFKLSLLQNDRLWIRGQIGVYNDKHGQVALFCPEGQATVSGVHKDIHLGAGQSQTVRFIIGWHYPYFKTFSPDLTEHYRRYYARSFANASQVVLNAAQKADEWSSAIDRWHQSLDVPAYFKRLWFSSLASAICSTMLSDDPYFFEIETPHHHIGTMDVNVYSSWLYLVNWPQLEQMEIRQFVDAIPTEGEKAGFVWHSLWNDPLEYSEEPTFILRVYRDALWLKDQRLLADGFEKSLLAANYVYRQNNYRGLLNSPHGNQSFDAWPMPGVSSYVNNAWLYALYALDRMAFALGKQAVVGDQPAGVLLQQARRNYDDLLWDEENQRWKLFYRAPGASAASDADSVFTDQLFGRWAVLLDASADATLDKAKVRATLDYIYRHNRIEDARTGFVGWVNGLLPGRRFDPSGHICKAFWICPQLDLGSLLGDVGEEQASLDVFQSIERSLFNNHLAVGEYNKTINECLEVMTSPEEPAKDTPRFPPYPRYKCCWEYLIRLLGFKADWNFIYLKPFRSLDFEIKSIVLATEPLTVKVQAGWNAARLDGKEVAYPLAIAREGKPHFVEFFRR